MHIPVFCYHNAIAEGLEKDLAFLVDNGYQTLLASELVDVLRGVAPAPDKPVALTFDDGLLSLRTIGLPLFERFGAKATVFAITGLTPDGRTEPAGKGDFFRLLGWDDLEALQGSGHVEIGSHGHRHNPVHVAADEGRPVRVADYDRLYDVPMPFGPGCDEAAIRAVDGTPSRSSKPLFGANTLLVDGATTDSGEAILQDLVASRDLLAARLGIDRPHLCLPYGAGNKAIPGLAKEAGFESVFWSRRPDRDTNLPGDDPHRIVRQKHDFLRRMPGRGRRSLLDVYVTKVKRRLTSDPWE